MHPMLFKGQRLGKDIRDYMTMNISQAAVDGVVAHRQSLVIKAQLVKHGGVGIIDRCGLSTVKWFVSPVIAFPVRHPTLKSSSGKPVGKHEGIVIPTLAPLTTGHPSKLRGPVNNRILKQTTLLQILDQGSGPPSHSKT